MNYFLKKYASTSRDYDTLSGGTVDHHHLYPHNKADTYFGVNIGAMQDLHFYPRFDYFRGYILAPETPFYAFYENLNCFHANQSVMDASSLSSLLCRDHYDPDRIEVAYQTDWGGKLIFNSRGKVAYQPFNWEKQVDPKTASIAPIGGQVCWSRNQMYFERNVMRPVLFQMKPEYLDGSVIPMECYLEVTITHTFKVLIEKRFNAPNEEKLKMLMRVPTAARDPPEGSDLPKCDFGIVRDDQLVMNIATKYYLSCHIKGTYNNEKVTGTHIMDTNCNYFTPAVFPIIEGRRFLADPEKAIGSTKKRKLPQRLDEKIEEKRAHIINLN